MINELEKALSDRDEPQARVLIKSLSEQQANAQAQIPLINLCLKHGFYDLSVQCFAKAATNCHVAQQIVPLINEPLLQNNTELTDAFVNTVIDTQPTNLELMLTIVDDYLQKQRLNQAEKTLKYILATSVHFELLARLAEVYFRQSRLHDAKASAQMALELAPENPQSYINLAVIEKSLNNLPTAAKLYSNALKIDESNFYAHINLAQLCLMTGQFDIGWRENEWRWQDANCRKENIPLPLWQGQQSTGHKLLVWADQGLGDQIMYLSLLNQIDADVTLKVDPRLRPLLATNTKTLDDNYTGSYSEFDSHCSLGSLPNFLIGSFNDFNPQQCYLKPDADNKLTEPLTKTEQKRITIGFSWRGGSYGTAGGFRSLALENWRSWFDQEQFHWVNLQYDSTEHEIEYLAKLGVHTPSFDLKNDLVRLSNQLVELDGYVGVDNSTIHLSGALGVPSLLLLTPIADWRWFTEEHLCYWYKTVTLQRVLNTEVNYSKQWQHSMQDIFISQFKSR